jgi:hypothetical protein
MGAAWAQQGSGPAPRRNKESGMKIVVTMDLRQLAIALVILLHLL